MRPVLQSHACCTATLFILRACLTKSIGFSRTFVREGSPGDSRVRRGKPWPVNAGLEFARLRRHYGVENRVQPEKEAWGISFVTKRWERLR